MVLSHPANLLLEVTTKAPRSLSDQKKTPMRVMRRGASMGPPQGTERGGDSDTTQSLFRSDVTKDFLREMLTAGDPR